MKPRCAGNSSTLFSRNLGWDVANKQGYAEAYKDVIHEDAIKVGGVTKAPDYCFRIGGARKFFLEAKKPSVNIQEDIHPAYQLRRYGWSAKLPLSILTDFEEFAVYDCRVKPAKTDKVSHSRILYLKYTDYADRWEEIAGIFSRDAILKGSFDKYVESNKGKKGTTEVDTAFLQEIENWRELLARNIALRNPNLSQRELNFAVQQTIDRIVFLRICEDRGMEAYGGLMALRNGENVYKRLFHLFNKADEKYNSGLFHFKKEKGRENCDNLTPFLQIDDKPLKEIFKNLYYPESPYEFSVLSADILGQVYEQFLGKVIRLTAGHQAKIEEKPEVRKAGGVYYTPDYIVDYIVKNTVGKLVEGKKPGPRGGVSNLKILDPACGSGSFLIGAYQFLLDWHRDEYINDGPENWSKGKIPRIYQSQKGEWRLTTDERKRILLNNIYGVDIDHQAVEVTKLSLLLKVLEGEDEQSIGKQMALFQERVLPDLSNNIKCGNSLIGPDFYDNQQMSLLDEEELYRVNAFDWNAEFPEIMKDGGFDAVIGNPPYLRIQGLQKNYSGQIEYYLRNYESAVKRFDLYLLFLEKGYHLLNERGCLGYINPHKFINSDFGSGLRSFLAKKQAISKIISFGNNLIFSQASTYTGMFFLTRKKSSSFLYYEMKECAANKISTTIEELKETDFSNIKIPGIDSKAWVLSDDKAARLISKLNKQTCKAKEIFKYISQGIVSTGDDIFYLTGEIRDENFLGFSDRLKSNVKLESKILKPILKGEDVKRYSQLEPNYYVIFPHYVTKNGKTKPIEEQEFKSSYPLTYAYLSQFKRELTEKKIKYKTNPKYWYSLHRSREIKLFETEKIITPEISLGCNMTVDNAYFYHNTKVYSFIPNSAFQEDIRFWLGLLNSKIMWFFLKTTGYVLRGGYFTFKTKYIEPFPIRTINFDDLADVARHDQIVSLVDQMLELNKKLAESKVTQTTEMLKRQIESTDRKIEDLVYKLYDLIDEEIKILESET